MSEEEPQNQGTNYLERAMFPADNVPAYAHISNKREAQHYAAVQTSTHLGKNIIDIVKKLKHRQKIYYIDLEYLDYVVEKDFVELKKSFVQELVDHKITFKKTKAGIKNYVKEISDIRRKYFLGKQDFFNIDVKNDKKVLYEKYVSDVDVFASNVNVNILSAYDMLVLQQWTHGISVKGHGRKEATGLGLSKTVGGTSLKEHKRSRMDKLLGKNKEPNIGEINQSAK